MADRWIPVGGRKRNIGPKEYLLDGVQIRDIGFDVQRSGVAVELGGYHLGAGK